MSVIFPATATVGLEFDLEPSGSRARYELLRMEQYFENTQAFTEMAKEIAQVDMAEHFISETDPEGIPWAELVAPAVDQVGILRLTTDMYEAAISEEAWTATPVGVFFNAGVLPDYWVYHEQPSGAPGRLPRRRFVGLSADAERNIENRGDEWLAGGLFMAGRFAREIRTPLGRFAAIP